MRLTLLISLYFFYFSILGGIIPYWGLYLNSIFDDTTTVGILLSSLVFLRIFAPYFWGFMQDKTTEPLLWLLASISGAALGFLGLFLAQPIVLKIIFSVLYGFFFSGIMPQLDTYLLRTFGTHHQYAHIRLSGSLGFLLASLIFGWLIKVFFIGVLPPILLALFVLIFALNTYLYYLSRHNIAEKNNHDFTLQPKNNIDIKNNKKNIILFLSTCLFAQLGHSLYYNFFTIYAIKIKHYDSDWVGIFWAIGVFAEVILFIFIHKFFKIKYLNYYWWLSLLVAVLRWALLPFFSDYLGLLILWQTLHAFTFALYHHSAIHKIQHIFAENFQARGHALYASTFAAGTFITGFLGGFIWENHSPNMIFYCASFFALCAFLLANIERDHLFGLCCEPSPKLGEGG